MTICIKRVDGLMLIGMMLVVLSSWATCTAATPCDAGAIAATACDPIVAKPTTGHGLVIVIRALAGYWPECDSFCQRVRDHGEHVRVFTTGAKARDHSADIARQSGSGKWSQIRIVGYSNGADGAIELARDLRHYGTYVERLILIEPTNPKLVPSNVGYCYNIYESRPLSDWIPAFRGVKVKRESSSTQLINYDVKRSNSNLVELNHFNFAKDARVQAITAFQAGSPSR